MFKEATMNRSLFAVPAMFCLAAALVTAQAPAERPAPAADKPAAQQPTTPRPTTPPTSAQQPTNPDASAMAANTVTYTGCVKPGTAADTWVLESAEVAPKAGAASTVGTSGTPKMTLNPDPAATVNLKAHANHKVEVVGVLSPAKGGADASSAAAAGAASSQAARQQFSVASLKMVSATCP
jgi:hypothetical protein